MYDLKPEWYEWYINDKPLGAKPLRYFLETDGKIDSVTIKTQHLPTDVGDLREESEAYLDKIIATCGSGVSACVISVALYCLGKKDVPIYDGSWTEWASSGQKIKTGI